MEPSFSATYCDDVRQEAGGKVTLVGCYGPVMIVEKFPDRRPLFFISFNLRVPIELSPKSDVIFEVNLNGKGVEGLKISIPSPNRNKPSEPLFGLGESTEIIFGGTIAMNDFVFVEPSVLEVIASLNDRQYVSQKLRVIDKKRFDDFQQKSH